MGVGSFAPDDSPSSAISAVKSNMAKILWPLQMVAGCRSRKSHHLAARLPRPLLRPSQRRRHRLDRIEQRPVALLQRVAYRKRRAKLQPERAQDAIIAVIALQH